MAPKVANRRARVNDADQPAAFAPGVGEDHHPVHGIRFTASGLHLCQHAISFADETAEAQ